ncbi:MAG: hypothetical protein ABR502_08790 [Chitinophagaceae bacterium]
MKKILLLLISFGGFASLFAQSNPEMEEAKRVILGNKKNSRTSEERRTSDRNKDPRDVVLGRDRRVYDESGRRYPDNYPYGSRDAQIEQVNREYDAKIQSIRNNPTLSAAEKERMIRQLNRDRVERIKRINNEYKKDRRYDDDDDDDYKKDKKDKKYKKNNGNHYGWEKGVGNPHRTGGKNKSKGKKG